MTIPSKAFEYYLQGFRLHSLMTRKSNAHSAFMRRATGRGPKSLLKRRVRRPA